ncbi:hypothetical protein BC833DRAFT_597898 [Globomyces pollinis-pini]|nr:hypothetical protein BC833DRAFT_597898 [Globomyces pollinis-pini]
MLILFVCFPAIIAGLTIGIGMTFGTLSHVNTYFHASKLLADRNHTIIFSSLSQYSKFTKDYPHIKNYDMGSFQRNDDEAIFNRMFKLEQLDLTHALSLRTKFYEQYEESIIKYREFHSKYKVDLMLCDFMGADACMAATTEKNITWGMLASLDYIGFGSQWYIPQKFGTPSIQKQFIEDYWTRTLDFLKFLQALPKLFEIEKKEQLIKDRLGLGLIPKHDMRKTLVFAHSFLGLVYPRPLPSNAIVFGPMISRDTTPIEQDIQTKLNAFHSKGISVVFIAFGSVANLEKVGIADKLVESIDLLLSKSDKIAVVWAVSFTNTDLNPLSSKFKNRFVHQPWVQQKHVLDHPAVKVFLTHGGQGSIHESIFFGKPLVVCPLFADQFANAMMLIDAGIGLQVKKYEFDPDELADKLILMLNAVGSNFTIPTERIQVLTTGYSPEWLQNVKKNVDRFKTIAVMNSAYHPRMVADAMEMAASVGYQHLIPADVNLTLFDRVPFYVVLMTVLTITFLINKFLQMLKWIFYRLVMRKKKLKTD